MRYNKYNDEEGTTCFFELNKFYCERAIYKTIDKKIINTYISIEQAKFFLPEGSFEEIIETIDNCSKSEFDKQWELSMENHESDWEKFKTKYQLKDIVQAKIWCFYPQGIILNFGEKFNAILDYEYCHTKFGKKQIQPNSILELTISKFDNINKIIVLK